MATLLHSRLRDVAPSVPPDVIHYDAAQHEGHLKQFSLPPFKELMSEVDSRENGASIHPAMEGSMATSLATNNEQALTRDEANAVTRNQIPTDDIHDSLLNARVAANSDRGSGRGPKQHKRLPKKAKDILSGWIQENRDYSYPTKKKMASLKQQTGLESIQITQHLKTERVRLHLPRLTASPAGNSIHSDNKGAFKEVNAPFTKIQPKQCGKTRARETTIVNTNILISWFNNHLKLPHPSKEDVASLSNQTGLEMKQVKKWFAHQRVKHRQRKNSDIGSEEQAGSNCKG